MNAHAHGYLGLLFQNNAANKARGGKQEGDNKEHRQHVLGELVELWHNTQHTPRRQAHIHTHSKQHTHNTIQHTPRRQPTYTHTQCNIHTTQYSTQHSSHTLITSHITTHYSTHHTHSLQHPTQHSNTQHTHTIQHRDSEGNAVQSILGGRHRGHVYTHGVRTSVTSVRLCEDMQA